MAQISDINLSTTAGPVILRSATPADSESLGAMLLATAAETPMIVTTLDEMQVRIERLAELIEAFQAEPDRLWLVALSNGEVVGELTCRGHKQRRLSHVCKVGMSVRAAWRGRGIGRGLLQSAIGWAKGHPRIRRVTLAVVESNRGAVGLYRSMGFVEEGRRFGQIELEPGRYVDDLIMGIAV